MPQRLADGSYVVLNREYKPLGYRTRDHIRYEDLPILAKIHGITPQVAAKLSWSGSEDLDRIMLYNDGCIPTASVEHMKRTSKRSRSSPYSSSRQSEIRIQAFISHRAGNLNLA